MYKTEYKRVNNDKDEPEKDGGKETWNSTKQTNQKETVADEIFGKEPKEHTKKEEK